MIKPYIQENVPLAPLTYYKIGGPAAYYCQPTDGKDLMEATEFIHSKKLPFVILGAGSNVLFDDRGFSGLVIHTSKLGRDIATEGASSVRAGAGAMVIQLLRLAMQKGLSGFEFLVGIPGSIGGVIAMNAGTKLGEAKDVLREVRAYNLATGLDRVIEHSDLKFSYRKQHFLEPTEIILGGVFESTLAEPAQVQNQIQDLLAKRKQSQPIDKPSCGSVFKNPNDAQSAWKLIADAGLRGKKLGGAQISEMHCNFIVNNGGAKASDVKLLIAEAKIQVLEKFGVELEEEVRIIPYGGFSHEEP